MLRVSSVGLLMLETLMQLMLSALPGKSLVSQHGFDNGGRGAAGARPGAAACAAVAASARYADEHRNK